MPASTIVASGGQIRLYDDSVQTFDRLPIETYSIEFNPLSGYSLRQVEPLAPGQERVYGTHASRVRRIAATYGVMERSLGVILSGDKGMGKSLMIRMLAETMRQQHRLPTVLVQRSTPGLASFLDELGEAVVVFDEFEKVFPKEGEDEAQNQFLSLFDGLSTSKRLYVLSVNDLHMVSDYMLNRPGRFHYHMRFEYPDPETVAVYLRDQAPEASEEQVSAVVDFSRKYDINFDHLRAIAFELRLGEDFGEVISDLNIKREGQRRSVAVLASIAWTDPEGMPSETGGGVDLFDADALQVITEWDDDYELRFRMRDARPAGEGYVLPAGSFEIRDVRDEDEQKSEPRSLAASSVSLRRPRHGSIDF